MTARRLISVLSAGVLASTSVVAAQPKTPAKKPKAAAKGAKAGLAPAKDAGTPAKDGGPARSGGAAGGGAAGAGAGGGEGAAVQMSEDPPPSDISGVNENPDAPRSILDSEAPAVATAAPARPPAGYPIEEVTRPITLPQNMSEVSINPHAMVSPYAGATALRARYGITSKIQLGLTYMLGGIFDDPATTESKQGFHPGKAVGPDVTVMLQDWIGVQVGVPVYISPLAVSLAIGAPIKFTFGDKYAIGGLDDLLNIRISKFAPTFYQEVQNATNANDNLTNTIKSQGELRVSVYGVYQYEPDLAFIGRTGIQMEDFSTGKTDGCAGACLTTFIYAGLKYSPRKFLDLGASIGFDDLAHGGSFAPAGFLAFRI
ncbi:MAG TPA: hypothetical protein VFT22_09095 [Kofleriaceae bacterium]|nr:hypothetical protein [Kofleriaceae bacterium]